MCVYVIMYICMYVCMCITYIRTYKGPIDMLVGLCIHTHHASPSTAAATARKFTACRGIPSLWPAAVRDFAERLTGFVRALFELHKASMGLYKVSVLYRVDMVFIGLNKA